MTPALLATLDDTLTEFTPDLDGGFLIQAHLQGDDRAFTRLDSLYRPRLLNFVQRMVRDRDRAEELVQETFLRVYRHGHRYDPSRKFSTWIYTIAGNLARNDIRRQRRSPVVRIETDERLSGGVSFVELAEDTAARPDEAVVSRSMMELVERTVARLSPIHRQVFVMRELEDKTYEEIAEAVGCDLGTVKSRLNRARRAFARMIAPYLD